VALCYLCACEVPLPHHYNFVRVIKDTTVECHAVCWNEMREKKETVKQFRDRMICDYPNGRIPA
jgi:hypothetical protein